MPRQLQHPIADDDDGTNNNNNNRKAAARTRRRGGANSHAVVSSSTRTCNIISFPEPPATATLHPPTEGDYDEITTTTIAGSSTHHAAVPMHRSKPIGIFTDDNDDVDDDDEPSSQPRNVEGDQGQSDRTPGCSNLHLPDDQRPCQHHSQRRRQQEMIESLRGDSFLRTNMGPMFGPLHHGSIAAVLRRPSHHHDDNTVVFRNGKLNVLRSRWILCYAHATIEDEFYVFAQSHRGGAIVSCFVAAALILLGNAVYAASTELTSLAFGLYATSIVGFLVAAFGMRWLEVELKALRVEYGLGDPLDGNSSSQSCIGRGNSGEGLRDSSSPQPMSQATGQIHPPEASDLGNRVGSGLRGFQNFLPLLVRDNVPRGGAKTTAAATQPQTSAAGAHQMPLSSAQPVVAVANEQQKYCWRHAFRRNAAVHEIFALIGVISCFVYSIGNISGRVCDEKHYGLENTLRVCNGVTQSDASYLFAMVAASFLMPVRFFIFVPLYVILSISYFGFKKATFIVPITDTAFWTSVLIMGTELVVCVIVRYLKEVSQRDEYEIYLELHLQMLEAGHIRRLTEAMVSAHMPLKAARTMLQQLQSPSTTPGIGGSSSAGGLFSWNSKRAVICTLSIGGFAQWVSVRSSLDAVELLQGLFQRFDQLREQAPPLSKPLHTGEQHNGSRLGAQSSEPPAISPPAKYHSFGDTFTAMYLDCRDEKDLVSAVQAISGYAVRALRGGQDLIGQELAAKRFMTAEVFGKNDLDRASATLSETSPSTPQHVLRTICHVDVGSCGGAFCNLSKTICPIGPLASLTPAALQWLQGNLLAHVGAVDNVLFARDRIATGGAITSLGATSGAASMSALVCSPKFLSILLRSYDATMPSIAQRGNTNPPQPFLLLGADGRADPRSIHVATLLDAVSDLESQENWMNIVRQQQAIAHLRSSNAANLFYGSDPVVGSSNPFGCVGAAMEGSGAAHNPLIPPMLQFPIDAVTEESPPLVPFRLPEGPTTVPPVQQYTRLSNRILLALHPFDTYAMEPTIATRKDNNNLSSRPSIATTAAAATQAVSTTSAPGEPSASTDTSHAQTPHDHLHFGNSFPHFSSTEARSPIVRSPRDGGGGAGGASGGGVGITVEISGSIDEQHRGVAAGSWNPSQQQPHFLSSNLPSQQFQLSSHNQRSTAVNTTTSDAATTLRISTEEGEGSSQRDDGIYLSSSRRHHRGSASAGGEIKKQWSIAENREGEEALGGRGASASRQDLSSRDRGREDCQPAGHEGEDEAEEDEGDINETEDPLVSATKRVALSLVGRIPPWNFLYRFDDPATEELYIHNFQSIINPRELLISKVFCGASFIGLIGVCALDNDIDFTPVVDRPLPWIVLGMVVCACTSVLALFTDVRGHPIHRFIHVGLSIASQTLYLVPIGISSANRRAVNGVSQLGDSQLLWLYVMLNWAVNRPIVAHPLVMAVRDVIVCGFFVFRTAFWFDVPGAPRMLFYYLYGAYIVVVLTMRFLGDAMRRYHFATARLVEYLRDELQNDYAKLYKSIDLMVPSGVAGRLTQKAKRANTRKLRLGWAGCAPVAGAGDEDVDQDGSMRPLRIYGLLSNSFATSVQDTAFLVMELQPATQHYTTASTPCFGAHAQQKQRSQGSGARELFAAAALDHFKTLDAIQNTFCASGKRYHRRVECVKATANRSFWCALSHNNGSETDDEGDAVDLHHHAPGAAALKTCDDPERATSSEDANCQNGTAKRQQEQEQHHRTLNHSGGAVSRNRALLRFALKCIGLVSPHTKARMFLHCGPIVGAVAGGRAVSFEFYGGPSQLALDCMEHLEWNSVAISNRFESSCNFYLSPLKHQQPTATADDEILIKAGLVVPNVVCSLPDEHGHYVEKDDKEVFRVVIQNEEEYKEHEKEQTCEREHLLAPPPSPKTLLPTTLPSPLSSSPPPPFTPSSVKLTVRIRGYPFPIHFRSLNMSGLRQETTATSSAAAPIVGGGLAVPLSSASGASTPLHNNSSGQLS
jgi:hypothetical protein